MNIRIKLSIKFLLIFLLKYDFIFSQIGFDFPVYIYTPPPLPNQSQPIDISFKYSKLNPNREQIYQIYFEIRPGDSVKYYSKANIVSPDIERKNIPKKIFVSPSFYLLDIKFFLNPQKLNYNNIPQQDTIIFEYQGKTGFVVIPLKFIEPSFVISPTSANSNIFGYKDFIYPATNFLVNAKDVIDNYEIEIDSSFQFLLAGGVTTNKIIPNVFFSFNPTINPRVNPNTRIGNYSGKIYIKSVFGDTLHIHNINGFHFDKPRLFSQNQVFYFNQRILVNCKIDSINRLNFRLNIDDNYLNSDLITFSDTLITFFLPPYYRNSSSVKVTLHAGFGAGGFGGVFTDPVSVRLKRDSVFYSNRNSITFSNSDSSTNYRLISTPFRPFTPRVFRNLGDQRFDWKMFRDNGDSLTLLSINDSLRLGEGAWVLKRGFLDFDSYYSVATVSGMNLIVELNPGKWNILGNPTSSRISWEALKILNNININVPLFGYEGSYRSVNIIEPFNGYYFFAPDSLKFILFPFQTSFTTTVTTNNLSFSNAHISNDQWRVSLRLNSILNQDFDNSLGVASIHTDQFDFGKSRKPPFFMDQAFLYFPHPEWDKEYPNFCTDIRAPFTSGVKIWDFEVRNPKLGKSRISFDGIDDIPAHFAVKVVNLTTNEHWNLRRQSSFEFSQSELVNRFQFIVGEPSLVQEKVQNLNPTYFSLDQNYPNPFNPSTTIRFVLPARSIVTLAIYDVLGRKVQTLENGIRDAGSFTTNFNAQGLSNGVYFYRLEASSLESGKASFAQTKKMIFVK